MAISTTVIAQATARASATHPLDPLTADEIAQASAILKSQRQLGQRVRFETVVLREPDKDVVLMFQPGTQYGEKPSWWCWTTMLRPLTRRWYPSMTVASFRGNTSPACSPG